MIGLLKDIFGGIITVLKSKYKLIFILFALWIYRIDFIPEDGSGIGKAIQIVSTKALNGENIGGKTFSFGIKEGCVGMPENNPNIPKNVYENSMLIKDKISEAKIIPPGTLESYNKFMESLSDMKI